MQQTSAKLLSFISRSECSFTEFVANTSARDTVRSRLNWYKRASSNWNSYYCDGHSGYGTSNCYQISVTADCSCDIHASVTLYRLWLSQNNKMIKSHASGKKCCILRQGWSDSECWERHLGTWRMLAASGINTSCGLTWWVPRIIKRLCFHSYDVLIFATNVLYADK
jgi:hypothetical protein